MNTTFNLLDGRTIYSDDVLFDKNNYQFIAVSTGEDITALLRASDKQQFADFDQTKHNTILFNLSAKLFDETELDTMLFNLSAKHNAF